MTADDRERFIDWFGNNYMNVSNETRDELLRYAGLVIEGSERMGLVARGDLPRLYMRHLREAIAPAFVGALPQGARVLDVGSGGGFPGVPLAILRKDLELTLLEPRHRRGAFLERAVMVLGLADVKVCTASIDAFSQQYSADGFGWVVSRGVAWTAPMVRCLERVTSADALLYRFGAPDHVWPGVDVIPISAEAPRAIQVWPRHTWSGLPQAR